MVAMVIDVASIIICCVESGFSIVSRGLDRYNAHPQLTYMY
jgi:hypothetical protein